VWVRQADANATVRVGLTCNPRNIMKAGRRWRRGQKRQRWGVAVLEPLVVLRFVSKRFQPDSRSHIPKAATVPRSYG